MPSSRHSSDTDVSRRVQAERDAAILSDLVAGMGVRATARKWGLAHSHIRARVDYEPNQLLVWVGRGQTKERGLFDTRGEARNP